MESFIERISSHTGSKLTPSTMKFTVKWLNYDDSQNTVESWKNLRRTDQLHDYLREHKMKHLIPKEFREPSD